MGAHTVSKVLKTRSIPAINKKAHLLGLKHEKELEVSTYQDEDGDRFSDKDTKCWQCKHAGFCRKPIDGWDAEKTVVHNSDGTSYDSWLVKECPNFEE
jgi:hypothetical protein